MSYVSTPFYGGSGEKNMSFSLAAATALGAGLSFVGGLASNWINKKTANQNIDFQREANAQNIAFQREVNAQNIALTRDINNQNIAFQQNENRITRQREDNAVQRAAADMQAAGLSKTLAAGNPASAAALTAPSANTPQVKAASVKAINNAFKYESALQKMNIASLMLDMASKDQQLKINDKIANAQVKDYEASAALKASQGAGQNISNENAQRRADDEHNYQLMQVNLGFSQIRLNNANSLVREKEGAHFEERLNTELDHIISSTDLNYANMYKANNEVLEILKRTEWYEAQKNHLDKQDQKLIQEIITEKLKQRSLIHDLGYAEYSGLPVGTVPNGLFGMVSNAQAIGNMATSGLMDGSGRYYDYDKYLKFLY